MIQLSQGIIRLHLSLLFLLALLSACDGRPAPLPPDSTVPEPADRTLFEPETLAAFDQATQRVRGMPTPQNWARLGRLYHAHEQLDLGISCYRLALEAGDQTNRTPHLLALALDETGDRAAALDAIATAAAREPAYAPTFWKQGQWQLEDGDVQAATSSMEAAVRVAPRDLTTHLAVGKFLLDTDQSQAATKMLARVVQANPQDRYAHYLLGIALGRTGNEFDSRAHLELGRHSRPRWRDKHHDDLNLLVTGPYHEFWLLSIASNNGQAKQSLPGLLALQERLADDANYYTQLTKTYRMLVEPDKAEAMIDAGLALGADNYNLHYQRAGLHLDRWRIKGQPANDPLLDEAIKQIDYTITLNPSSATSHALRGKILSHMGQSDQSAAAWQQADQLDTENSGFGYRAAKVYLDREQWAKAAPILVELVERYPYDKQLLRKLAMTQYAAGLWPQAKESILEYQTTDPNDLEINAALEEIQGQ